jgi:hypothetical protein
VELNKVSAGKDKSLAAARGRANSSSSRQALEVAEEVVEVVEEVLIKVETSAAVVEAEGEEAAEIGETGKVENTLRGVWCDYKEVKLDIHRLRVTRVLPLSFIYFVSHVLDLWSIWTVTAVERLGVNMKMFLYTNRRDAILAYQQEVHVPKIFSLKVMAPPSEPQSGTSTPRSFANQTASAEDLLKSQTVGLVNLSDFRKRRAEVLELKEKEAQDRSYGRFKPSTSGSTTPALDNASDG